MDTTDGHLIERLSGKGRYWDPAWSPDDRRLAFYSDQDGTTKLWEWNAETHKTRAVTNIAFKAQVWPFQFPLWSPSGEFIVGLLPSAFSASKPAAAGIVHTEARATPSNSVMTIENGLERISLGGDTTPQTAAVGDAGISPVSADILSTLAVVDARSGDVREIAKNEAIVWYSISPDGLSLGYSREIGFAKATGEALYDIVVSPVNTSGKERVVAAKVPLSFGQFRWSPDGKKIAYVTEGITVGVHIGDSDLYVVDIKDGRIRNLTGGKHEHFTTYFGGTTGITPYWSGDSKRLAFTANGDLWTAVVSESAVTPQKIALSGMEMKLIVECGSGREYWARGKKDSLVAVSRSSQTNQDGFVEVNLASGASKVLREDKFNYGGFAQAPLVSDNGNTVVFLAEDEAHPPDFWIATGNMSAVHKLTDLNPTLNDKRMGVGKVITFKRGDGKVLRAALLLPANYKQGTKYPMLVRVYPGEYKHSNMVHNFGLSDAGNEPSANMQILASHGYAVLFPETPVGVGTPMNDIVEAVNASVDKVVEMGIADPDRLGVFGFSFGGYGTLATIVQTSRFKVAVEGAGLSDLWSESGDIHRDGFLRGQAVLEGTLKMDGDPWTYSSRYWDNSPIHYLDRITTPLLIYHGELDRNVPIWQSDEVVSGLIRLGKTGQYRVYAGEGHGLAQSANIRDLMNAELAWFDRWLGKPAN